jgi:hypothetical protein
VNSIISSDLQSRKNKLQGKGTVNRVLLNIVKKAVANVIADKKQKIISIVDIS